MSTATSTYAIIGTPGSPDSEALAGELRGALEREGFTPTAETSAADLVLNFIDPDDPKPFRRSSRGTFAAAVYEYNEGDAELTVSYPYLVRALANTVMAYVPGRGVWFTTLERGHYSVPDEGGGPAALAASVVARLAPLARARLIIDNEFLTDLEPELWAGDENSAELIEAGRKLDELDLLPSPFPIDDLLDERDLRQVKKLYQIGGLSYGNLSQRLDANRFWMSASGVDKGKLEQPGRDVLLVVDYDEENGRMVLSVPPGIEPRRVSVDAIEHWMIYQAHADVGAILHVHAWMDGISATDVNYPCGTHELAVSVAELVDREPDPAHAVIGLRNHGITATGDSLMEILDRIAPRIIRQVPML